MRNHAHYSFLCPPSLPPSRPPFFQQPLGIGQGGLPIRNHGKGVGEGNDVDGTGGREASCFLVASIGDDDLGEEGTEGRRKGGRLTLCISSTSIYFPSILSPNAATFCSCPSQARTYLNKVTPARMPLHPLLRLRRQGGTQIQHHHLCKMVKALSKILEIRPSTYI